MSDEPNETQAAPEAPATPAAAKPQSPIALIAVVAGALIAGAAVGGLLVGPKLVAGRTVTQPKKDDAEKGGEAGDKGDKGDKGKAGDEHTSVYKMDNIIVNPAGSQGMHFLMVSIAIEVPNMKMEAQLKSHEAELRDLAISILERQTMETLNVPGARDQIKEQLHQAIVAKAGTRDVRVFLPQFVIQ